MMGGLAAALLATALQLPAARPPAPPQTVPGPPLRLATGMVPDTVTVGDEFRAVLRLQLPAGAYATFPALPTTDTLQQVDTVRVLADSAGSTTAMYSLVVWVAGITPAASVPVEVVLADGRKPVYRVPLRLPFVRSVLPADTVGLKPKPPKGLVPIPLVREWWRLLLLGLALLAALCGVYWLWRRARRGRIVLLDPRAAALARLDELRAAAPGTLSELAPFYAETVRVLRVYLAALDPRAWGESLTSTELVAALERSDVPAERVGEVERLLAEADPVKFAGAEAESQRALRFWEGVRSFVEGFDAPGEAEEEGGS
jgi:hypothetical protein